MAGAARDSGRRDDPDQMANALRVLAIDAVETANSGHPGAPMGMAEMGVALWHGHLRHNPANPQWPDRDRFVLSNGHASALLYGLLHLTGYDLPLSELKRFRQLGSRTPGHPEVGVTPGVETTTGPLGQGLANAVGMALAEKLLADEFNRPGFEIVNHRTYVFLGDGCLMEGISHEACSLAGVWKLNKLVALYDDNGISIDGPVQGWFQEDTAARFRAYGWDVLGPLDGHSVTEVGQAIAQARRSVHKPTIIICRTTIGMGSPNRAGTAKAHGEPLGTEEMRQTRQALDWRHPPFEIPAATAIRWNARELGAAREAKWQTLFDEYGVRYSELALEFQRRVRGDLPASFDGTTARLITDFGQAADSFATRKSSQKVLTAIAAALPELLGGSADLTGSNLTDFPDCGSVTGARKGGRYVHYGVREFAMAAVMNGVALHRGFLPYGGTFLAFSDYSRNAIRLAALMRQRVVHIFTHDSVALGEDGPTHQPVEHAASLRLIPNLEVWRPCDSAETAVAWIQAITTRDRPSALLLSRQPLPAQVRDSAQVQLIFRGGYVLSDRAGAVAVILATGSEVSVAIAAQAILDKRRLPVRVVSIPSSTTFDRQEKSYRVEVLGRGLPRIGVEAGVSRWWSQYGCDAAIGVDTFGESGSGAEICVHFGLTPERLADAVEAELDPTHNIVRSSN